jgi:hypothetical protein
MAEDDNSNWEYKPGADLGAGDTGSSSTPVAPQTLTWTGKEFIEHERSSGWYVMLILGTILLAGIIYLLTKDYFAVGATVLVGIITAVYVSHKPKELTYEISSSGIKVGEKNYNYSSFKSFAVLHEGAHSSISLEPIKKYMPPMTLYFPPENEDQISNAIGNYLPLEEREQNITERLAHRFRI